MPLKNSKIKAIKLGSGFSLIEMAIVLVVVGLLLGGLMAPLATQIENSRRNETQQIMAQSLEAIYGYSLANGRLPCPDTTGDGAENRVGNNCKSVRGNLPWATLAIGSQDAWGQAFLYRVTNSYADLVNGTGCGTPTPNISFSLCSTGDIQVLNAAGGSTVAVNVPAVIVSRAKKRAAAAAADEAENNDNDAIFVSKNYTSTVGTEFDDIVNWVVPGVLVSRMVNAGRLP